MSEATYILSGKVVTVDIPDNHAKLLAKKTELKQDKAALMERIISGVNAIQRKNIDEELSRVKSELSIVNQRLQAFARQDQKNKFKDVWKKKRDEIMKKGYSAFPDSGDWEEKYKWCLSLLDKCIGLHFGRNESVMNDEELLEFLSESFSVAVNWEKSNEFEKSIAKSFLQSQDQ